MRVAILTSVRPHSYAFFNHLLERGVNIVCVAFEGDPEPGRRVRWLTRLDDRYTRFVHRLFLKGHPPTEVPRHRRFGDVRELLLKHGVPWHLIDNHNDPQNVEWLELAKPDLLILAGTRIIKQPMLDVPNIGTLNAHSALLPRFRGGKAEFWILYREEPESFGVTIHWVNPGLDTGGIVLQERIPVHPDDTPATLRHKAQWLVPILLGEAIRRIAADEQLESPQDDAQASTCKFPTPEDIEAYRRKFPGKMVF
jgi:methionyl-tRNA formyltransferase